MTDSFLLDHLMELTKLKMKAYTLSEYKEKQHKFNLTELSNILFYVALETNK